MIKMFSRKNLSFLLILFFSFFLLFLNQYSSPRKLFSNSLISFLNISSRKDEMMISRLLDSYKSEGKHFNSEDEIYRYYLENKEEVSNKLSSISLGYKSIFPKSDENIKKRLNYRLVSNDKKLMIMEDTNSNYIHTEPNAKMSKTLDFEILTCSPKIGPGESRVRI